MIDLSNKALLVSYAKGNVKAFDEFFKRNISNALRYAVRRGLSTIDAQDAVQMAFEQTHKKIKYYDSSLPALPWFYTLVHHACIEIYRSDKKFERNRNLILPEAPIVEETPPISLKGLNKDQKKVINYRLKDLSFKEIAKKLKKKEAALRKIHERAVAILRENLTAL